MKAWVPLEAAYAQLPLHNIPWLARQPIPTPYKEHPLMGPTIQIFPLACKKYEISSSPWPLTLLVLSLDSSQGMSDKFLLEIWPHLQVRAEHFFQ